MSIAISVFPGLENPDMVFPTAMLEILPVGLLGLVLAGLISAIMSSVDSTLNSSSTLVVIDFIQPRRPDLSETELAKYGRVTTLILTVIAAFWAPQITNFTGLWDYLQQMFSIVVPPIAVIFLVGVMYKRGNGHGAFWTLILGTLMGVLLFVLEQFDMWHLHYTINVGLMVAISTIIFIMVSNMTPAPEAEKIDQFTYRPELISEGTAGLPWYQDYRFQAAGLVILVLSILISFW